MIFKLKYGTGSTAIYFLLLLFLTVGCSARVYVPSSHHVPFLEKKGDLKINSQFNSTQVEAKGADFHLAYAFGNNMGIGASGTFLDQNDRDEKEGFILEDYKKHKYGELSLISFLQTNRIWRAEIIASVGMGRGEQQNDYVAFETKYSNVADGSYNKLSLQTNIGIETKIFDIGISPKVAYVEFNRFNTNDDSNDSDNLSALFWEPALFLRFGFDSIKVELQSGGTEALQDVGFYYDRHYISFGLDIAVDKLFRTN